MLSPMDGLTPLTRYNFDVRAKIHEMGGHWCGIIQYVGTFYIRHRALLVYSLCMYHYMHLSKLLCVVNNSLLALHIFMCMNTVHLCKAVLREQISFNYLLYIYYRVVLSTAGMFQQQNSHLT